MWLGSVLLTLLPKLGRVRLAGWLPAACLHLVRLGTVCLCCGPEPLGVPVSGSWKPANLLILKHDYLDVRDKLPVDGDSLLNLGMFEFPGLLFLDFLFESKAPTLSFSLIPTTTCLYPTFFLSFLKFQGLPNLCELIVFPCCDITAPRKTRGIFWVWIRFWVISHPFLPASTFKTTHWTLNCELLETTVF